jgi:hypothetical protein
MKKIIIATVFAIMTIMFVYAQDNSTDTVEAQNASPDAVTEATKSVNVKVGVAAEAKDQNRLWTEGKTSNDDIHKQYFNKYRNRLNAKGGLLVNFNDAVVLSPYVRIRDFGFITKEINAMKSDVTTDSDRAKEITFGLHNGSLNFGLSLAADPTDWFSIEMTLFQWDYFTPTDPIWVGLGGSLGLSFYAEKAFFSFDLWDEVSVRFTENDGTKMMLLNYLDYGFQFNFFNFINPKINTGLYTEGEFELDLDTTDGKYDVNELYNEFYIGIKSSPLPFMSFWTSFFVQADANYNDDLSQEIGSGSIDIGLQTGITFSYNGFSASFNYEPHLGRWADASWLEWEVQPIKQQFTVTIGYKFKTYFTKK